MGHQAVLTGCVLALLVLCYLSVTQPSDSQESFPGEVPSAVGVNSMDSLGEPRDASRETLLQDSLSSPKTETKATSNDNDGKR